MNQVMAESDAGAVRRTGRPKLSNETRRRLGKALRAFYEEHCDAQPVPTQQIDLLLQLRQRERALKRP